MKIIVVFGRRNKFKKGPTIVNISLTENEYDSLNQLSTKSRHITIIILIGSFLSFSKSKNNFFYFFSHKKC